MTHTLRTTKKNQKKEETRKSVSLVTPCLGLRHFIKIAKEMVSSSRLPPSDWRKVDASSLSSAASIQKYLDLCERFLVSETEGNEEEDDCLLSFPDDEKEERRDSVLPSSFCIGLNETEVCQIGRFACYACGRETDGSGTHVANPFTQSQFCLLCSSCSPVSQ